MPGAPGKGGVPAPQALTWNSLGVDASLADTLTLVRGAQDVLAVVKANAQCAQQLAAQWSLHLLYERKDAQAVGFAELQAGFRASFGARSAAIREGGREIAQILADSLRMLNMGRASSAWLAFVDYIAATVVQGLRDTAHASLKHLLPRVRRAAEHALVLESAHPVRQEVEVLQSAGRSRGGGRPASAGGQAGA